MTTRPQTFNRTDVEQTREDLERVRRDRLSNPGTTASGFIKPTGETSATPGDLAPFARVVPFPTPEQDYGRQNQVIGFQAEFIDPVDSSLNTLPVIDVEDWRQITFTLKYIAGLANGQLAVTPLYGNDERAFPLPLFAPSDTLTPDGEYGYRVMYKQQFRTPVLAQNEQFEIKLTFDVSAYRIFALSVRELNQSITCSPDDEIPLCSVISLRYALSM